MQKCSTTIPKPTRCHCCIRQTSIICTEAFDKLALAIEQSDKDAAVGSFPAVVFVVAAGYPGHPRRLGLVLRRAVVCTLWDRADSCRRRDRSVSGCAAQVCIGFGSAPLVCVCH